MSLRPSRLSHIFMSADAVGGVWTYVLEIARGMSDAGAHIQLAVLGPSPSPAQYAQADLIEGLELISTGLPLDWTATNESELDSVAQELRLLGLRSGADLVHLNAPAHAGKGAWRLPLVISAHSCVATWWHALHKGPLPGDLVWRARRTAAGLALADIVLAPSRAFARAIFATYGDGLPVVVVHNGRTAPQLKETREKDCVLTAGRLWDAAKNIAAIDTAAALSGITVHAAGETSGPNGGRATFPNLKLIGSLSQNELAQWQQRAKIFISVSKYEPFGLVALEAAQAGAALVLSNIPTFTELWNGAAVFIRADDPHCLAKTMELLLVDDSLRERLAAEARARARKFDVASMLSRTSGAYKIAVSRHTERQGARRAI